MHYAQKFITPLCAINSIDLAPTNRFVKYTPNCESNLHDTSRSVQQIVDQIRVFHLPWQVLHLVFSEDFAHTHRTSNCAKWQVQVCTVRLVS